MINKIKKIASVYSSLPIQVKASLWFVASTVLLKGIAFITVPIFTRVMNTEQYGHYSVYLSWVELFTILGTLSMEGAALISGLNKYDGEKKVRFELSLLELSFLVTSVLLVVVILFGAPLASLLGLSKTMLWLLVFQIYFTPAVNFWLAEKRFDYSYKSVVFVSISMAILNAGVGLIAVLNCQTDYQAVSRVGSIVLVQAVYGSIFLFSLLKHTKLRIENEFWKWTLSLQLPLLPHSLSLKVLASADRIMINSIIGASAAAMYSVAYSVSVVVNLIKTSIVDAFRPWVYKNLKEERYDIIPPVLSGVLVFVSLLTVICIAFAPEIIKVAAPKNYYDAIYCIPPVIMSSFFTFLYSVFSIVELYFEESKKIMIASVSSAVLNIALNALMIPMFGYIAAAYTTLICYIFLAIAHYVMLQQILKKNRISIKLFDLKHLIIISTIMLFIMVFFVLIYNLTAVRMMLIVLIIFLILWKKQYFLALLKTVKN